MALMRRSSFVDLDKRRAALAEAFSYFQDPETELIKRTDLPLLLTIAGVDRADEVLAILMGSSADTVTWDSRRESAVLALVSDHQSKQSSRRVSAKEPIPAREMEGIKHRRRHSLAVKGTETGVLDGSVDGLSLSPWDRAEPESTAEEPGSTAEEPGSTAEEPGSTAEEVSVVPAGLGMETDLREMRARNDFIDAYKRWCPQIPGTVKLAELESRIVWGVLPDGTTCRGFDVFSKVRQCMLPLFTGSCMCVAGLTF